MKKFKMKYIILFLASFLLSIESCTKLDENVYDALIAEDLNFTAKDIPNLIAPAYVAFRDSYFGWDALLYAMEESSDCMVIPVRPNGWGAYYVTYHQHGWTSAHEHIEGQWYYQFQVVNACNKALYQLSSIQGVEGMDNFVYQLRAMRATAYFWLLDFYRNVPIVTNWDVPKGFVPDQNTASEVYDFVETELKESLPYLKEDKTAATYGTYTKWAAKMTLAKLYLNSEVYGKGAKYNEALAQVNDIIASGKFSLTANPLDAFKTDNENNSEAILAIPLDEVYASFYAYPNKTLNNASGPTFNMKVEFWGGTGMIPQFIDTYDAADERLKAYLGGPQYNYKGEPLMDGGVQINYTNYLTDAVTGCGKYEGWRCVKYELKLGLTTNPGNDLQYYRYTDALMIKAECLLRTGDAAGAAAIVTNIRQRSFTDNPAKATVTGAQLAGGSAYQYGNLKGSTMTDLQGGADIQYGRFLDELGWEFVFEAHRKQDLIRFGVYNRKRWFCKDPSDITRAVFPIPKSQLETNSKLVQNPGYIE